MKTEETIVSVTALRDSRVLNHNTEEMTLMARATEKSGIEVATMTQRMENDARLMKFLAEVTAFFLPITAIATIFSMDFFSINTMSMGPLPTFPNLKYCWIYVAFATPISFTVFIWCAHKRHDIFTQARSGNTIVHDNEDVVPETAVDSAAERTRRKQVALTMMNEAEARMKELDANPPPKNDEDANRVWDREHKKMLRMLLVARRAYETGEDFESMFRSTSDRVED